MIRLRHVYKTYPGPVHALRNISFEIEKGEFVYLTGPSGAGKTTLFRMLSAFDLCTSGEVQVGTFNLHSPGSFDPSAFRRSIGMVFQDYRLIDRMSLVENVSLPLVARGVSKAEAIEKAHASLASVGLSHRAKQFPEATSGGEQQRASVARALIHEPKVILADEPTGNLDPSLSEEIIALLEKASHRGAVVFVATHDWNLVKNSSKRQIQLREGQVALSSESHV